MQGELLTELLCLLLLLYVLQLLTVHFASIHTVH